MFPEKFPPVIGVVRRGDVHIPPVGPAEAETADDYSRESDLGGEFPRRIKAPNYAAPSGARPSAAGLVTCGPPRTPPADRFQAGTGLFRRHFSAPPEEAAAAEAARNVPGVTPKRLAKQRMKYAVPSKPHMVPTSLMEKPEFCSS